MGKGDKKTRKGKINIGSYGVTRKRNKKGPASNRPATARKTTTAKAEPKKETADKAKKPAASAAKAKTAKSAPAKKAKSEE